MKHSKYGARPFGVALLTGIGVAFALTIGIGLSRSRHVAPRAAEAEDDALPVPGAHRPQMLAGKIDLIKVTPLTETLQQFLPSVGKVACQVSDDLSPSGVAVWLRGPRGFGGHQFKSTIQFGDLPPVALRMDMTTRRGIVVVRVPANYPPDVRNGLLRVSQLGKEMGQWRLRDLPPSRMQWKSSPGSSKATYGPVGISLRAWHAAPGPQGAIGFECFPVQTLGVAHPNEHWEIDQQFFARPQYGGGDSRPLYRSWVSYAPSLGANQWSQDTAYPSVEKSVHLEGRFVRYATYDEQIRFPGVRIEEAPRTPMVMRSSSEDRGFDLSRGQRILLVRCARPITAQTASGVKMTIYPSRDRIMSRMFGDHPVLAISFTLEKGLLSATNLPTSPISQNGRYPVWLTPLSATGTRIFQTGLSNSAYRDPQQIVFLLDRKKITHGDGPQTLGIAVPNLVLGKETDLVLTIRHRVDLEKHPFILEAPIEARVPADLAAAPAAQYFMHR